VALTVIGTWTSAETTDNLITSPYEQFLDSKYEYPNIHMHGDGSYDPYIYTGASLNYKDNAVAEHQINLDKLTYEITQVNYGYKYYSYAPGEVAIAIALIDENGTMIDDSVMDYNITTGQWINVDRVYNDMEKLSLAKEIWMGIAGSSDWNGTDDIRIGDIYLTYDYQEIPLDLITDPVYDIAKVTDIKYDLDANGVPKIEEIKVEVVKVDEVKVDTPTVSQPVQQPVQQPTVAVAKAEPKVQKQETKKGSKKEVKKKNETKSLQTMRAVEIVSLVDSTMDANSVNSIFSGSSLGNDALTDTLQLVDNLQLIEMEFYEDTDFYDEVEMADSGILNNYTQDFYKETPFYGGDTQFY